MVHPTGVKFVARTNRNIPTFQNMFIRMGQSSLTWSRAPGFSHRIKTPLFGTLAKDARVVLVCPDRSGSRMGLLPLINNLSAKDGHLRIHHPYLLV